MATTKLQDHAKLLSDTLGWMYQQLKVKLGDSTGTSTASYGVAQQIDEIFNPSTADLDTEIDVKHMAAILGKPFTDVGQKDFQNAERWMVNGAAQNHRAMQMFQPLVDGYAQWLSRVRTADQRDVSYTLASITAYDDATYANRFFHSPEFALIARSIGRSRDLVGGAVRAPSDWFTAATAAQTGNVAGVAGNVATLTYPSSLTNSTDADIVHGSGGATFVEIPDATGATYASYFGAGTGKLWVGLQMELVNIGNSVMTGSSSTLKVYFTDADGTKRSVTFTIASATYANGDAVAGPAVDANSKIFAAFRDADSSDAGVTAGASATVSPGTSATALQSTKWAIRFKDVSLAA